MTPRTGRHCCRGDLTKDQLAAAPVLASIDTLVFEELS
jgi:hypothetical protein